MLTMLTNYLYAALLHIFWCTLFIIMRNTLLRCSAVDPVSQIYDLVAVIQPLVVQYDDFGVVVYNCYYQADCNFFCVGEI